MQAVGFLLEDVDDRPLAIDVALDLADVVAEPGVPLVPDPARVHGTAGRGPRGVWLDATLDCVLQLDCCRCLERFAHPLHARIRRTLVHDAVEFGAAEQRLGDEDASLFPVRDGRVDLREVAAEQIHLELPLKPLCSPECRGLCPTCGANRNRIECGCVRSETDPRLASLERLRRRFRG